MESKEVKGLDNEKEKKAEGAEEKIEEAVVEEVEKSGVAKEKIEEAVVEEAAQEAETAEGTTEEAEDTVEEVEDTVEEAKEATEEAKEATEEAKEATEEVKEATEEVKEKTEAEPKENTEEEAEENTEEEAEEDDTLCPICKERHKAYGEEYCGTCKKKLIKTRLPFLGVLAGIISILLSLFALCYTFVLVAPSLQVMQGDAMAEKKNWYQAFNLYQEVDTYVDEVNSALSQVSDKLSISAGCNLRLKELKAYAGYYTPLEAADVASQIFDTGTEKFQEKNKTVQGYKVFYDEYMGAYEACSAAFELLQQDSYKTDDVLKALENARGTDGVKDVYIDYFLCSICEHSEKPLEETLAYYKKIDESAKKEDVDYSWLYYNNYATILVKTENFDTAIPVLQQLLSNDTGALEAAKLLLKSYKALNKTDEFEKVFEDYKAINGELDRTYALQALYLRLKGEYAKAELCCEEGLDSYPSVISIMYEESIAQLLEGKVDKAYENAFNLFDTALQNAYYYGDSSDMTDEIYALRYLTGYLYNKSGGEGLSGDCQDKLGDLLEAYEGQTEWPKVKAVIDGEKTVEEIFTTGDCDVI